MKKNMRIEYDEYGILFFVCFYQDAHINYNTIISRIDRAMTQKKLEKIFKPFYENYKYYFLLNYIYNNTDDFNVKEYLYDLITSREDIKDIGTIKWTENYLFEYYDNKIKNEAKKEFKRIFETYKEFYNNVATDINKLKEKKDYYFDACNNYKKTYYEKLEASERKNRIDEHEPVLDETYKTYHDIYKMLNFRGLKLIKEIKGLYNFLYTLNKTINNDSFIPEIDFSKEILTDKPKTQLRKKIINKVKMFLETLYNEEKFTEEDYLNLINQLMNNYSSLDFFTINEIINIAKRDGIEIDAGNIFPKEIDVNEPEKNEDTVVLTYSLKMNKNIEVY